MPLALAVLLGGLSCATDPAATFDAVEQSGRKKRFTTDLLGIVFLCAGFAFWLEVSFLLAGMVTGAGIVSFASDHDRPLHEIKRVEWPFMLLFFHHGRSIA